MKVSYIIPEANHSGVKVLEVALNPEEKNAQVNFDNGDSGKFSNNAFLTLWGEMNSPAWNNLTARETVKNFVDAVVDRSKVNGSEVVVTDGF